eukprot:gnl/MRDRNA2_/MRDRNA2_105212_c0_seq1.p1 gnl/MRDRNA2_/MRDRNA2_105212_c0~~gnl/MRDRNA2_/MRDRNA2_105212_c0_seq1.p1  ORF type:complete len:440 (-),score=69.64 gnl/MRDRNA2_/MRDRNA2_105212_c0_seq1:5-1276(-)
MPSLRSGYRDNYYKDNEKDWYDGYDNHRDGHRGYKDDYKDGYKDRYKDNYKDRSVARPGDWKCPSCDMVVFASKFACVKCGYEKTDDVEIFGPDGHPYKPSFSGSRDRGRSDSFSYAAAANKDLGSAASKNKGYAQVVAPPEREERDKGTSESLAASMSFFKEADVPNEAAMRNLRKILEHPLCKRQEVERVLIKLQHWLVTAEQEKKKNKNEWDDDWNPLHPALANNRLIEALSRTLRRFSPDPQVVALVCGVMARAMNFCGGPVASGFLQAGALDDICQIMENHNSHGGLQNVCCWMLLELVRHGSISAARQAAGKGAVDRILDAMEMFTMSRQLQYYGCEALRILSDRGRCSENGLREAAVRAKVAFPGDPGICDAADEVLWLVVPRFKAHLCWHWQGGHCAQGVQCTYAHGVEEIRTGP